MCSQACLQEMEKFWKDSIRSLLVAALSSHHHGKCLASEVTDEQNQATSTISSPSSSTPTSSLSTNTSVNLTPSGSKQESSTNHSFSLSPLPVTSQIAMNNSNSLTPMVEMTASLLSDIISNLSVLKSNQSSQQQNQAQSNTKGKVKRKRRRKRYTLAQKQRFLQQSVWSSTENNDGQLRVQSVLSFQETHKMSMLNQEENLKLRNHSINTKFTPAIGYLGIDGELKEDSDAGPMNDPLCKNSSPSTIHESQMQSTESCSHINDADIHNGGNGSFDKLSAKLEDKSLRMEQIEPMKRRLSSDEYLDSNNLDHFSRNNYDASDKDDDQLNREKKRNEKLCSNHGKSTLLETSKLESHVKHSSILASFAPSKSLSSSSLSPKNGYLSEGSDKELISDGSRKIDNKLKQTKIHGHSRWDDSSSKDSNKPYLLSSSKNINNKEKVDVIQSSNGNAKKTSQEKIININLQSIDARRFSSAENDHLSKETGLTKNDQNKSCDRSERRKRSHSKSAISPNRSYKSRRDEVRDAGKGSRAKSQDKKDSSRSQSRSKSRSKSSSRSRSRNRSRHRERSRERRRNERKHRHGPSSSGYRGNKDKISSRSRSKSQTSSSRNKKDKSSNGRSRHRSRKHSSHRRRGHSSRSSSAYSTSSTSSSASSLSRSSSSSDSSRFSSLISRSSRDSKSRSKSRSPSIRRRGGSPNFLERRRITSARKRPTPYHRDSPSSDSSSSESPISKCKRTLSQRSCSSSSSTSSPCYYYLRKSRSPSL